MYQKIHLRSTRRLWDRNFVRSGTAEKRRKSQYNPYFSREVIERLEMETAREEAGHLIEDDGEVATFYRKVEQWDESGAPVGVSMGEFTEYIFVVRQAEGSVHGYPITQNELVQKKGVRF